MVADLRFRKSHAADRLATTMDDLSDWRSVLLDNARRAGVEDVDLASEHARWGIYQRMMDSPADWDPLRELVAAEPDSSVAVAVVLAMLERVPAAERMLWVDGTSMRKESSLVILRRQEVGILEAVSGDLGIGYSLAPAQVSDWSDWLQRRASQESTSPAVLEQLTQSGRTRRVRHLAAERLRFLRRTA
jgi:hypothetical protein